MLQCNKSFICSGYRRFSRIPHRVSFMSRQLTISAAFSAFAMALFALVMRADGPDGTNGGGVQSPIVASVSLG